MSAVGAVILAAGFGTRLAPLTNTTPKPLLEVGGAPVVSHLLGRLAQVQDLHHVVIVVNDQHLGAWRSWQQSLSLDKTGTDRDIQDLDIDILSNGVVSNDQRLGAVADLAAAVRTLPPVDWTLVIAGDNLLDEDLQSHLDAARRLAMPVLLCRDLGENVPPGRFGEVTVDQGGLITQFREKPEAPESPLVATCTYVLPGAIEAELSDYLLEGDPDSPGQFIAWLADQRPVLARPLAGRYFDIGNHETLAEARQYW